MGKIRADNAVESWLLKFRPCSRFICLSYQFHISPCYLWNSLLTPAKMHQALVPGVPEKSRLKQISLNFLSHVRYY